MVENANFREVQFETGFTTALVGPCILYHSLLHNLHVTRGNNIFQAEPARQK